MLRKSKSGSKKAPKRRAPKKITSLRHSQAKRRNIPTKEMEAVVKDKDKAPIQIAYERRNRDLDPQLVWRGKDEQDLADLLVQAPPLYIQEKIHPKVLMDDLMHQTQAANTAAEKQTDMFADFNNLPSEAAKTEFYQHDSNWSNRMILGDSLQAMASLSEREGLKGKVQMIYMDPPYGIKFNSNFQWSTTSRDVKDGKRGHITREPEQVKAFRDTWRDGIHSYLSYLRDRLEVARSLLTESGSCFVQIGDENVHRVRAVMDEVFGDKNFISEIKFKTTSNRTSEFIPNVFDSIIFYAKNREVMKFYRSFRIKDFDDVTDDSYGCVEETLNSWRRLSKVEKSNPRESKKLGLLFGLGDLTSSHEYTREEFNWFGKSFGTKKRYWSTSISGLTRLGQANRLCDVNDTLRYKRMFNDTYIFLLGNIWSDLGSGSQTEGRTYVVQTLSKAVERCLLMTTDPGDLVLDPTCGSGTTAHVAEQWGRRWITMDTSRVSLALARARLMGARYPFYLLADTTEGQAKEAEITRSIPKDTPAYGDIRQGFVYQRVPHITLKSIANNAEIDVIYDNHQKKLEPLREKLNHALKQEWQEWQVPREASDDWPDSAQNLHKEWWAARTARQKEIDASIAAKADTEYLYDKPYLDNKIVRVAGPFTVESISPHRPFVEDENGNEAAPRSHRAQSSFVERMMETLKAAGIQQAHKEDRINFTSLDGFPGHYICAEGRYDEGEKNRSAGVFIGPEFGTISRDHLAGAAREAAEAGFDILIACAFSYEAACVDLPHIGKIRILQARMNADLHMAADLKDTASANLFVVFGQPDIDIEKAGEGQIRVRLNGVDVFKPATGKVESSSPDEIAMWFVDSDYNEESFFVRQAYFLGASDPYKGLKTTLKADINSEAWESLYSEVSRAFDKPKSGRIAVKVINHLGDEVMKIFEVK